MNPHPLLAPLTLEAQRTDALADMRRRMQRFDQLRRDCGSPHARPLAMVPTPDDGTRRPGTATAPRAVPAGRDTMPLDAAPAAGQGSIPEPQKLRCYRKRIAPTERQHASIVRGALGHVQGSRESGHLKPCAPDLRRVSDPRTACGLRDRTSSGNTNRKDPSMSNAVSGRASVRLPSFHSGTPPLLLTEGLGTALAASAQRGLPAFAVVYRPSYPRRALAHLHTGSLPPAPCWGDMAPLTVPAVAALLGLLVGGML